MGEQGDYYDPLFTYREDDEASYFIFDEPEGCAADVGPLGAGKGKKSPMASSLRELGAEHVASEGGPSTTTTTEAFRTLNFFLSQSLVVWQKLVLLPPLLGSLLLSQSKSAPQWRELPRTLSRRRLGP